MTDRRALLKLEAELKALEQYQRVNKLEFYRPYAKQRAFHAAGKDHDQRLLMAANQVGKTICGAAEGAMHLTGLYPEDWPGHRFNRPISMWAASVTTDATRDNVQAKLMGPPEREDDWGTGFLPQKTLLNWNRAIGTPNLLDSVTIRHASGGISTLGFKSYSQGREKWQGPTKDALWLDEEPPLDIYMEGMTRTNAIADRRIWITFTPLLGMSDVVAMFLKEGA